MRVVPSRQPVPLRPTYRFLLSSGVQLHATRRTNLISTRTQLSKALPPKFKTCWQYSAPSVKGNTCLSTLSHCFYIIAHWLHHYPFTFPFPFPLPLNIVFLLLPSCHEWCVDALSVGIRRGEVASSITSTFGECRATDHAKLVAVRIPTSRAHTSWFIRLQLKVYRR